MTDPTHRDAMTMSEDEYKKARLAIRFGSYDPGIPKPADPTKIDAMKMSEEEYSKARRAIRTTGRSR